MKTDRRTKYTQTVIREAFLQLLKTESVERVTVTDICRLADINRTTFYRHYESQYALLSHLENAMLDDIKRSAYEYGSDIDRLTEAILCKFYAQRDTWTLLLSDHADLGFRAKIYGFFADYFAPDGRSKESDAKYRFLLHGYSGLIDEWAKGGMKESPEKMAGLLSRIRRDITR